MQKYVDTLKRSQLFYGVGDSEIVAMLNCLQAKMLIFKKGDYIFREGERIDHITVLVEGKILVQHDDFWGNRNIVNVIRVGEMFGEAYVAPESGALLNDVIAEEDSSVIFFDIKRILTVCSTACRFHSMVVQNLFFSISEKNRSLVQKIGHMSKRSTRAKLLSYLSDEAKRHNSNRFTIPFSRQQLADFLCVDRSAMSNELCKMRDEGLLKFDKNEFILL
ncbi:MAG: Crp/Fnr family transcriptional regulator [Lachnospiraceae bacterium]|nr:Crp/Fnr family transcriptional regulator [Lachnospiraceae bacterium]MBP3579394.1 Crp/Fnr family transcriptional regulator [Lachnospiraceae bacterium]